MISVPFSGLLWGENKVIYLKALGTMAGMWLNAFDYLKNYPKIEADLLSEQIYTLAGLL